MDERLVDVSCWLDDFTFPGDQPLEVSGPLNVLSGHNPEFCYEFSVSTQAGTHVQAPHYFLRDGARIDQVPLERFSGPARIVDVPVRGRDVAAGFFREALAGADLAGRILILRTGHMDELVGGRPLEPGTRPGISLDAARYLADEAGISMIGIDSVGVESRVTSNYEVNVLLCGRGVLILEGLVNLARVPVPDVWLDALPLKIRGVEGTPCRAVIRYGGRWTAHS